MTAPQDELREKIGLAVFGGNTLPTNWETDSRIPRIEALINSEVRQVLDRLSDLAGKLGGNEMEIMDGMIEAERRKCE